jgi:hypothetical protein
MTYDNTYGDDYRTEQILIRNERLGYLELLTNNKTNAEERTSIEIRCDLSRQVLFLLSIF